jgi:hypothetical protein
MDGGSSIFQEDQSPSHCTLPPRQTTSSVECQLQERKRSNITQFTITVAEALTHNEVVSASSSHYPADPKQHQPQWMNSFQ